MAAEQAQTRGYTLIEVLIAMAIGVAVIGAAWSGIEQLRRLTVRNQVATVQAIDAGAIYAQMASELGQMQHGSLVRIERFPVDAGVYGAGRFGIALTWFAEMPDGQPDNGMSRVMQRSATAYTNPFVWYRWEWRPQRLDGTGGGLFAGRSSGEVRRRTVTMGGRSYDLSQVPQSRRARQRSIEDNDFRFMPNMASARIMGDLSELRGEDQDADGVIDPGEDVDGDGALWPGQMSCVASSIVDASLGWVDYDGNAVTASSANGVVRTSAAGSVLSTGSDPWNNGNVYQVDGLWRDARAGALAARPLQVRLMIRMRDRVTGVERTCTFSFALGLATQYTIAM